MWRAAARAPARTDQWRDARTHRAALRAVEEAVCRFVTRDFVEVVNDPESGWTGPKLAAGRVLLGTNRIRLELILTGEGAPLAPAWLEWEDRFGWLVAGWSEPGFLTTLSDDQARVFGNALAYLYKRAGVDLVWDQVRTELPKEARHSDLCPDGLLVWYGARESAAILYDIADPAPQLRPRVPGQRQPTAGPVLDATRLMFNRVQITWEQWTAVWRPPAPGDKPRRLGPAGGWLALLPPRTERPTGPPPSSLPPAPDSPPSAPPAESGAGERAPDRAASGLESKV
jgi:hypothetical protein